MPPSTHIGPNPESAVYYASPVYRGTFPWSGASVYLMEVFGWQGMEDGKLSSAVFFVSSCLWVTAWRGSMPEFVHDGLETLGFTWAEHFPYAAMPAFVDFEKDEQGRDGWPTEADHLLMVRDATQEYIHG